jgi:hypothetical protein
MANINSKKVVNATKWSLVTEIFAKLISPFTNMILARLLVPEAFGAVATITMIITFADVFTDAGFQKYIVQHEFKDEEDFDLDNEFVRFINFIYNPYNKFMIKINALANYDVCKVLTDKFIISGLSITTEDIGVDGILSTIEIVEFIIRCNLIDDSFLDSKKLKFICDVSKLN